MNFRKLLLFFVVSPFAAPATAADIYFAATAAGSNNGADCADAYAYTDAVHGINGSQTASWVAGNTLHLCGTITGAPGATGINIQGSGTSGSPITIKFETNAILTAPYWAYGINNYGHSYITIDGGANGLIENTANGSGLAYAAFSVGIFVNSGAGVSNLIIKNLTIANLCQHTSITDYAGCQTGGNNDGGIFLQSGTTNVTVTQNTIHDTQTGIAYQAGGGGDSGVVFSNNTISRTNWGIGIGNGVSNGLVITGNDISCVVGGPCNWNDTLDIFHHNGIMIDPQSSSSLFQNMVISNNFFHDINPATAGIFFDEIYSASISNAQIYNNVFYTTPGQAGPANGWTSGNLVVNNTIIGPSSDGPGGGPDSTIENNIISTVALGIVAAFPTSSFAGMISDYNDIYNLTGGIYQQMCANNPGYNCYGNVAAWIAGTGFDVHSTTANPNLTASFTPNAGSPTIGAGINMTSYCSIVPGLCLDRNGSQRPMCGSWDIGAYQYCTSNCNSAICSPAIVAQPQNQTVAVGQTGLAPFLVESC